jgi:PPOX class probable F420-dependent enzyme
MDELNQAKYIAFGTYRRDGNLVTTPTWVVPFRDGYAFTTGLGTWKAKRLTRDQRVMVTPCDIRGRALAGATTFEGRGEVLEGTAALEVERSVRRKYRIMWLLTISPRRMLQKVKGESPVADGAIYFEIVR